MSHLSNTGLSFAKTTCVIDLVFFFAGSQETRMSLHVEE